MQGGRLEPGMHLLYAGREHIIEKFLSDGQVQLKDIATNQFSAHAEEKLRSDLFAGHLTMLGYAGEYNRLKEHQKRTRVSDLAALEDKDPRKREARRREAYVRALDAVGRSDLKFTADFLMPIIEKVGHEIGDMPAEDYKRLTKEQQKELKESGIRVQPSPTSVYRWYIVWEEAAKDVRALIAATASQGNTDRKISKDVEKCDAVISIISDVVDQLYLTPERPSVQDAWDEMDLRIRRENEYRDANDKLPIPHLNTLYKIIHKIDPYECDLARYGKRYADAKHKAHKRGTRPTRPLERVEIDETQLPFMVIDPVRLLPVGRPWLIWAIDVFTRLIIGFYLSFIRPSYAEFMQCLLHAIKPKDYVREKYPRVQHEWQAYGLMEMAFTDNAKIYYASSFDESLSQLGIGVGYSRRRTPQDKPYVERSFWTYARRMLRRLPGTTFSNILEKADYDPMKHALVSFDAIDEITHIWLIDIYARSKHRGLNDVPARVWEESIKKFPPRLPSDVHELEMLIGHIAWRVVGPTIEFFGLLYSCDALSVLRQQLKGKKAKIKFNPEDISLIWVYDPANGIYIPVPALDQEYTRGLSLWQHNIIREYAKRITDGYVKPEDLWRAREAINSVIAEGIQKMKAVGLKTAHWLAQEQRRASLETEKPSATGSNTENTQAGNHDGLLNEGSHPSTGISDFSCEGSSDDELSEEGATSEHYTVETAPARKQAKTKPKKGQGRGKATGQERNEEKDESRPGKGRAADNSEEEAEKADPGHESGFDKEGWSADYDLPV